MEPPTATMVICPSGELMVESLFVDDLCSGWGLEAWGTISKQVVSGQWSVGSETGAAEGRWSGLSWRA